MFARFTGFSRGRNPPEWKFRLANGIDLVRSGTLASSSVVRVKNFSTQAAPKGSPPGPRSTPFFRLMNPEFYVKPNAVVALLGTVAFVGVLGSLYLEKRSVEKQRAEAKAAAEAASVASGRTLSDDSRA